MNRYINQRDSRAKDDIAVEEYLRKEKLKKELGIK